MGAPSDGPRTMWITRRCLTNIVMPSRSEYNKDLSTSLEYRYHRTHGKPPSLIAWARIHCRERHPMGVGRKIWRRMTIPRVLWFFSFAHASTSHASSRARKASSFWVFDLRMNLQLPLFEKMVEISFYHGVKETNSKSLKEKKIPDEILASLAN